MISIEQPKCGQKMTANTMLKFW